MTTVRPPRHGATEPTPEHRPRAVVVAVRRLFGADRSDVMLVQGTTIFLVLFGLVMVLSSSAVTSSQNNEGDFFAVFARSWSYPSPRLRSGPARTATAAWV